MSGKWSTKEISVSCLVPNEQTLKVTMNDVHRARLAESIRRHGLINPLPAESIGNGMYRLLAANTRFTVCKDVLGYEKVLCRVWEGGPLGPAERRVLHIDEQLCKLDPNPIEVAQGYRDTIKDMGLPARKVADITGWDEGTMSRDMKLLELPPDVQELIAKGEMSKREGYSRVRKPRKKNGKKMKRLVFKLGGPVVTFMVAADQATHDYLTELLAAVAKRLADKQTPVERLVKLMALGG